MPSRRSSKRPHKTGSVRPMGRQWEGRFHHSGKPVQKSLGVRKEVEPVNGITKAQAFEKLTRIIASYEPAPQGSNITFETLCSKFEVHKEGKNLSPNSLEAIKSAIRVHLRPEFGPRLVGSLSVEDLESFQAKELRNGAAPKSIKNRMSILHSILEYAVTTLKILKANVAKEVAPIKAPKTKIDLVVLSTSDLRAVRDAYPDTQLGRSDATMVLVAARSGLRQGELISLRWKNVDWDNGWIRVAASYERISKQHKAPKSYKPRALPLTDEVKDALLGHFKRSRWNQDSDLVFPHPVTGDELDGSALNGRFKQAVIKSRVRDAETEKRIYRTSRGKSKEKLYTPVTWHDLRHAFGTFCAASGVPMAAIEDWIGHEDTDTLRIYLHYRPGGFELDLLNKAVEEDKTRALGPTPQAPQEIPHTAEGHGGT